MGIDGIAKQNITAPQNTATQGVNQAPAALQGARSSKLAIAVRVLAGVTTLGMSESIRVIAQHAKTALAEHSRVRHEHKAQLAQARIDSDNYYIACQIGDRWCQPARNEAFYEAVDEAFYEAIAEVQNDFNNSTLDDDFRLSLKARFNIAESIRRSHDEMTPERLKSIVKEETAPILSVKTFNDRIQKFATSENRYNTKTLTPLCRLAPAFKDLDARLQTCKNAKDLDAVFDDFKEPIKNALEFRDAFEKAWNDEHTIILEKWVQHTGESEDVLYNEHDGAFNLMDSYMISTYGHDVKKDAYPTAEDITSRIKNDYARAFIEINAMADTINALDIDDDDKQYYNMELFKHPSFARGSGLFLRAQEAANSLDKAVCAKTIELGIQDPRTEMTREYPKGNPSNYKDTYLALGAQMYNFSKAYVEAGNSHKITSKQVDTLISLTSHFIFDKNPELVTIFNKNDAMLNALSATTDDEYNALAGLRELQRIAKDS